MDADTTVMLEGIGWLVFAGLILAILARIAWRSWRKERARRINRPVRAKVVESVCSPRDDWEYPFSISTKFEIEGRFLTCHRLCASEASAQAFAAKYAESSSHEVIPSLDVGGVFVPEDFRRFGTDSRDASFKDWAVAVALIAATVGVFGMVIFQAP